MMRKQLRQPSKQTPTEEKESRKRAYRTPQLTEWGTILELTEGAGGMGAEDMPINGGSQA